jgi:hypothetical protein
MRVAVIATLAACWLAGPAPAESPPVTAPPCPTASEIVQRHLLGLWQATFDGLPQGATLLLEPHPELAQSVRGAINRNGARALLAGDVDDGEFTLEESVDGTHISATWTGSVIDDSCGREIRGDWQGAQDSAARPFVLRKLP